MDTIFALASAQGRAGVAVIRISGPGAIPAANTLLGQSIPKRGMTYGVLRDENGDRLDDAIVLSFQKPNSFTGEDIVELQTHGSIAVTSAVLRSLSNISDLRSAEAGEFTRRALENGKLDLAQIEGLADLIDAETEAQRRQAQRVFSGSLGKRCEKWRKDLVRAAALLEAVIDFADEEVPVDVTPEVSSLLTGVNIELEREADGVQVAERIRSGFEVAIVGPPNVGKSTLLNTLAGRKAAITSEIAGTTRDVIEVRMELGGLPVTLLDTAGIRLSEDHVEKLGVELAKQRAEQADLRVFLTDSMESLDVEAVPGDIHVVPKADQKSTEAQERLGVSGKTGQGVDTLVDLLTRELSNRASSVGIATRERHRIALLQSSSSLAVALQILRAGPDEYDIVAEELRSSIRALETLVGRVDVEDLLDEIFASFCVGK